MGNEQSLMDLLRNIEVVLQSYRRTTALLSPVRSTVVSNVCLLDSDGVGRHVALAHKEKGW